MRICAEGAVLSNGKGQLKISEETQENMVQEVLMLWSKSLCPLKIYIKILMPSLANVAPWLRIDL